MNRFFTIVALLFSISISFATIWHVNNIPNMAANFDNLTSAVNSTNVLPGDTLYVYGSAVSYGGVILDKRLTIIGPGYFLNQNPGLQHNINSAIVNTFNVVDGAEGSVISGLIINGFITIQCNNVVVQRNYLEKLQISSSNVIAIQNYIYHPTWNYDYALHISSGDNIIVANNFIYHHADGWGAAIYTEPNSSGQYSNNVVRGNCFLNSGEFYNNIFWWASSFWFEFTCGPNTLVHHNVFQTGQSSLVGSNNNISADYSDIFVCTGSTDGYYQLTPNSPAKNVGVNGVDCGMFGGNSPYKLSGIPAIPTISEFYAPSTGFIIPIQIRAKSNN